MLFCVPCTVPHLLLTLSSVIAVDGTFLKGRFVQTLLLAVTINADGIDLLLV